MLTSVRVIGVAFFGIAGPGLFERLSGDAPSTTGESTDADDLLSPNPTTGAPHHTCGSSSSLCPCAGPKP